MKTSHGYISNCVYVHVSEDLFERGAAANTNTIRYRRSRIMPYIILLYLEMRVCTLWVRKIIISNVKQNGDAVNRPSRADRPLHF